MRAREVPTGRDELGDLGRAIETARDQLAEAFADLSGASTRVALAAKELTRTTETVDATERIADQVATFRS